MHNDYSLHIFKQTLATIAGIFLAVSFVPAEEADETDPYVEYERSWSRMVAFVDVLASVDEVMAWSMMDSGAILSHPPCQRANARPQVRARNAKNAKIRSACREKDLLNWSEPVSLHCAWANGVLAARTLTTRISPGHRDDNRSAKMVWVSPPFRRVIS